MTWAVVLELPGVEPELLASHRSWSEAHQTALTASIVHQHTGGKVSVSKRDSADQLQRYSEDRFVRDQPSLAPLGESVEIHVPTMRLNG